MYAALGRGGNPTVHDTCWDAQATAPTMLAVCQWYICELTPSVPLEWFDDDALSTAHSFVL
jgi:hypothetical protein